MKIKQIWYDIIQAATLFMKIQKPNHFEFYGLDIIVDENKICWLIEINRLYDLHNFIFLCIEFLI